MPTAASPSTPSPEQLREAMVDTLVEMGAACSPEVIQALRTVPRHLFPGIDPGQAYDAFLAALKKKDQAGVTVSTMSATHIQAVQLEQARVRPGSRVLEIGSGGVNAAYLAELVGPSGLVVTMDIDEEVTARAAEFLADRDYPQVRVLTADAGLGAPEFGPYDRIIVTVETTDIPAAWWDQLADHGTIVAPVRWRGQRRTVALQRTSAGVLVANDIAPGGFVPMQGLGEARESAVVLHEVAGQRVVLRVDGNTPVDTSGLSRALVGEKVLQWTGVLMHSKQVYGLLDLWLTTVLDDIVAMTGDPGAHEEAGLIPKPSPVGWPVLVDGASMAYRTLRPVDGGQWELGVIGHGPDGAVLAERYAEAIKSWPTAAHPRLTVTRHPPQPLQGLVHRSVARSTSTFTISWP